MRTTVHHTAPSAKLCVKCAPKHFLYLAVTPDFKNPVARARTRRRRLLHVSKARLHAMMLTQSTRKRRCAHTHTHTQPQRLHALRRPDRACDLDVRPDPACDLEVCPGNTQSPLGCLRPGLTLINKRSNATKQQRNNAASQHRNTACD